MLTAVLSAPDDDYIYLVIDLLLGGDLKFHLIEEGSFSEERTRMYAAELLLALEHLHRYLVLVRSNLFLQV